MNNSENNSDFYKLKYLKYKNKYISLKNKNELELKGGLTSEEGPHVFYIPVTVFEANNFSFPSSSLEIHKNKKPHNLTFQELYDMSVLVIPYAADKVNISSTEEWYIPQKSKGSFLKKNEPIKWGVKKPHTFKSPEKWLYYIAKKFLDAHPKLKLPNLDNLDVYCLEFDINKRMSNKFKSYNFCQSFSSFNQEIKKNQEIITKNGGTMEFLQQKIRDLEQKKRTVQTEMGTARDKYNDAKNVERIAEETVEKEEKNLKETENINARKKISDAIESARKTLTEANKEWHSHEAKEEEKKKEEEIIEKELNLLINARYFLNNDSKFLTENSALFTGFLT
jgi:hypothetical protein